MIDFTFMYTMKGKYKFKFKTLDDGTQLVVLPKECITKEILSRLTAEEYFTNFGESFELRITCQDGYAVEFVPYECPDYKVKAYSPITFRGKDCRYNTQVLVEPNTYTWINDLRSKKKDLILFTIHFYKEIDGTLSPSLYEVL